LSREITNSLQGAVPLYTFNWHLINSPLQRWKLSSVCTLLHSHTSA